MKLMNKVILLSIATIVFSHLLRLQDVVVQQRGRRACMKVNVEVAIL